MYEEFVKSLRAAKALSTVCKNGNIKININLLCNFFLNSTLLCKYKYNNP